MFEQWMKKRGPVYKYKVCTFENSLGKKKKKGLGKKRFLEYRLFDK